MSQQSVVHTGLLKNTVQNLLPV